MTRTSLLHRPLGALLAAPVAALAVMAAATAANAAPPRPPAAAVLYASPTGSGTTCASTRPCSLTTAQSTARTDARSSMDVTVYLLGGTYQLSSPLTFTSADSGLAGHRVAYQAVSGQTPVFSGGRTVTGWKQYDTSKNIWVASAAGISATRQLYVNGRRAALASAPASSVFGKLSPSGSGYTADQSANLTPWSSAADQPDLVYPNAPFSWTESMCGISGVSGTSVTMANPCFSNLTTPMAGYTVDSSTLSSPSYVENNRGLLSQPGQFYVDSTADKVYYIPRSGESMSTASVVAPQLSSLVTASNVSNLTIAGITFSYTTWNPSTTQGVVDIQSNVLDATSNSDWALIPSAVAFTGAKNVVFAVNTLTHLGGGGVSFDGGGSANAVTGNVVSDASSTGISDSSPLGAPESGDQITDNYVHHVAQEYEGGVGIFAGAVSHTTIAHNEVWNVPSMGISLGWGWGSGTSMTDNHVDYNRVHDVNSSSLFDGGAIYLNGAESGAADNSSVVGNYISGDPQPFGAIYLESGASNYKVSSNVVAHTSTDWVYLQTSAYGTPATSNTITGNYTDTAESSQCVTTSDVCPQAKTADSSNGFSGNTTGLTSWPSAATSIISAAGLESSYKSITNGTVDTDQSYATTATSTSNDAVTGAQPGDANDGSSLSAWTSDSSATDPAVWQTDLGSAVTLSELQVLTNQYDNKTDYRSNFKVVVSNSPITATSPGTTVCSVGSAPLAFQDTLDCSAPSGTWRYVGVIATGGQQLSLAEVRAFGH